jgi:hypothetical protein
MKHEITVTPWRYVAPLTADEIRDIEARGILPDGHRARIPLTLMDSAQVPLHDVVTAPPDIISRNPRAGVLSDEQLLYRDALAELRDAALTSAWRNPFGTFAAPAAPPVLDTKDTDVYDQHNHALTNAWRNPPAVDPVTAAPSPQQHTPQDSEQLYAARDRKLTEAWRNPQ